MLGLGTLFRVAKKLFGKPLEDTGILPTRYYVREILEALDHDNIGEAVRLLKKAKGALIDRSKLDFTRQQIIFRCRVLREGHKKRISYLEDRIKAYEKNQHFPLRLFRKEQAESITQYQETLDLEREAHHLLEQYEAELKDILTR
jgi:predicted ATP-grasp superfamily ATP-dependent carboligase